MDRSKEGGFALPVAIFALVIAMTVIAGSAFIARQETRIGSAVRMGAEAFYLAETGITDVMFDWDSEAMEAMAVWSDTTITEALGSGNTETRVTRIGQWLYLLESVSDVTEGGEILSGASREAAMVVRLYYPEVMPPAALTTRGSITVRGAAEVHGEDQDPAVWAGYCPGTLSDQPGVLIDNGTNVSTEGAGQVTGSPAVVEDPFLNDSTFTEFGGMSYAEMTTLADMTLPPGIINTTGPVVLDGVCQENVSTNWGDPLNPGAPCGDHFPLIHVPGNLRIQSGGVGQGVLLVDGDLDLRGDFVFYGVIIVQGSFETQGNGNRVYGGVMAGNATIDAQVLTGGSAVDFSSCAATRAVFNNLALTRPRPLTRRSWVDMSAVRN